MRKFVRRAAVTGAAVVAAVGATAALAPAAGAAEVAAAARPMGTVAPYNGACGAGYTVVNSAEIGTLGTVYLTYNNKNGNNCVVTIRNSPGTAVTMVAQLTNDATGETVRDEGQYTSYAGPVYLHAPGACVSWSGLISTYYNGKNGTNCATLAR